MLKVDSASVALRPGQGTDSKSILTGAILQISVNGDDLACLIDLGLGSLEGAISLALYNFMHGNCNCRLKETKHGE